MKKLLLSLLFTSMLGVWAAFASWYTDHIKPGANLYMFDIMYPYWPESTYFACWNINLAPHGGYFYGGVSSPKAKVSPGGVWSFWEHAAYQKRQVRNIYTAKYVYTKQYIGEGASGSAGSPAIPFIKEKQWYTMALRIWTPETAKNESYIGWWIKDIRANKWHLYGVFCVPYQANGFEKNSGFLEDFGHNGRDRRAISRGAGFCLKDGLWFPADTISINIAQDTGLNSQRWLVEAQNNGESISIQHSQNVNIERNLEGGATHYFKIKQPLLPTLDKPKFTTWAQLNGDNLMVGWAADDVSSPQLGYKIEVFEDAKLIYHTSKYLPFVCQEQIKLPKVVRNMSVKVTLIDIFNQQHSIVVNQIDHAKVIKPKYIKNRSLINGVNYQLYTFDSDISSVAELPFGCIESKGRIDNIDLSIRSDHDSNFGALYQGYIYAPQDGLYGFKMKSCDGSLLEISGQNVINNDSIHSSSEKRGAIFLGRGYHSYQVSYFKNSEENDYIGLHLEWALDDRPFDRIDNKYLFVIKDDTIPKIDLLTTSAGNKLRLSLLTDLDKIEKVVYFSNGKELEQVTTHPFDYLTSPVEGSNEYIARVYYKNNISTDSRVAHHTAISSKAEQWSYATIGEQQLAHKFGYDNGTFTISGEGEYYIYKEICGDFEISGYVDDFKQLTNVVERENWIGLMVKQKLSMDNDNDIAIFHTSASGLRSSADFSDYATTRMSSFRMNPDHKWLKITRQGNIFTTYSSQDGKSWIAGLQRVLPMPEQIYVGTTYLSTPGNTNSLFYGSIKNITIKSPPEIPANQSPDFRIPDNCNVMGYSILDNLTTAVRCKDGLKLIDSTNQIKTIELPKQYAKIRSVASGTLGLFVVATDRNNSSALLLKNGDRSWQKLLDGFNATYPEGVYGEIIALNPVDGNHLLLGCSGDGVYETFDGGKSWAKNLSTNDTILELRWNPVIKNVCSCLTLSENNEGKIHLSYDNGTTWQTQIVVKDAEFRHLLFDRRVDNLFYINSTKGVYTSFTNCRTINRIMVHLPADKAYFASDGVVINLMRHFAIPVDGSAIYRSDIDQLLWNCIEPTPNWGVVFALDVDKIDKRTIRAFTQNGVYLSDDNGMSWRCITPLE